MLVLAVHTVNEVTAKVAFSTILLQDFITNKKVPIDFKCRQLVPTSGQTSTSLWDVSEADALLQWLNENIAVDCSHQVFEVQEDFGIGLGEVVRARAAERMKEGGKDVAKAVGAAGAAAGAAVQDIDTKLRISERAGHAMEAVKESTVVQNTAAVLTKAGSSVKTATTKVLEQPAVHSATEAVGSGFRKLGQSLSTLSQKVYTRKDSTTGGDVPFDDDEDDHQLPSGGGAPVTTTTTTAPGSNAP